jgi:soluble lytic murein transglycosylase-like protein
MQLMPATARMLGVDPSDPIDNLGRHRLPAGLLAQFGNTRDALIAYNAPLARRTRARRPGGAVTARRANTSTRSGGAYPL